MSNKKDKIIKTLDEYIKSCEDRIDDFNKSGMESAALCSSAMKQAYLVVKDLIDEVYAK